MLLHERLSVFALNGVPYQCFDTKGFFCDVDVFVYNSVSLLHVLFSVELNFDMVC